MAENDAVTWGELKDYCAEKQLHCNRLREQEHKTFALQTEGERRAGMGDLLDEVKALGVRIAGVETRLSSKAVFVLPRPILYLLCVGMIGAGVAFDKIGKLIFSSISGGIAP